jgi:hypothetical protein
VETIIFLIIIPILLGVGCTIGAVTGGGAIQQRRTAKKRAIRKAELYAMAQKDYTWGRNYSALEYSREVIIREEWYNKDDWRTEAESLYAPKNWFYLTNREGY